MKKWLIFPALFFALCVHSQSEKQTLGPRLTNTALYLDPTEVQTFGSLTGLLDKNLTENQYIPFAFGGSQSIYGKQISEDKAWELFAEFGVFTQFEWLIVEGQQQRNLINADYKAAISYARQVNAQWTYRLRFFHVSSHLGDDYIIRNSINNYTQNKVNYEQLEISFFYLLDENIRLNAGLGSVVRPDALRLPFSFHLGANHNQWTKPKGWGLSYGWLLKGMQENDFTPGIKLGIGLAYFTAHKKEPLRILLEYYTGHLPYSQFEKGRIEWLGLGMYFYL
ncbi:MAG: DUF1207 domain-containing protein [Vicingaceae bacterium]